jgi:hypothetical protein
MAEVEISRKLTVASLGLPKATIQELIKGASEGDTLDVAAIYGIANKYQVTPSKLDPTKTDTKFVGRFEGINMLTGETVAAANAYLPGAITDALSAALDVEGSQGAEFKVIVGVRKSEKSAVGYVFTVRMDREPAASDPLAHMRLAAQEAAASLPQIEAPGKAKRGRPAKAD